MPIQVKNDRRPPENQGGRHEGQMRYHSAAVAGHFAMIFFHKNIRLEGHKYTGRHSYFITVCCEKRRPVFANSQNAAWLVEKLREKSSAFRFAVRAYCVMPNHFHALVTGLKPTSDLLEFVKSLKLSTAREYAEEQRRPPENQGGRYETSTANQTRCASRETKTASTKSGR